MSFTLLDARGVYKACQAAEESPQNIDDDSDTRLQRLKALAIVAQMGGLGDGVVAVSAEDILLLGTVG